MSDLKVSFLAPLCAFEFNDFRKMRIVKRLATVFDMNKGGIMCETERAQDGTRAGSQHQREQRMDVTRLQSKPTHQEREIRESLNSPGGELYKSR